LALYKFIYLLIYIVETGLSVGERTYNTDKWVWVLQYRVCVFCASACKWFASRACLQLFGVIYPVWRSLDKLLLEQLTYGFVGLPYQPGRAMNAVKDGTASVIATSTVRSLEIRLHLTHSEKGTALSEESCRLPAVRLITAVECLPCSS